ncbi:MAG: hypothetical protein AAF579_04620 [Cyanobacteria bacterium P01_C01_bin.118]
MAELLSHEITGMTLLPVSHQNIDFNHGIALFKNICDFKTTEFCLFLANLPLFVRETAGCSE